MNAGRRSGSLAALALVAAVGLGLLAGCAGEPTRIQPGTSAADTIQRLGAPTGRYPLTGGGERLQYSRMPAGFEVVDIDVDASGKVVSVTQVLNEARFGQDIKVNQWRQNDVMAFYMGVEFQSLEDFKMTAANKAATVDFGSTFGVTLGVMYAF